MPTNLQEEKNSNAKLGVMVTIQVPIPARNTTCVTMATPITLNAPPDYFSTVSLTTADGQKMWFVI